MDLNTPFIVKLNETIKNIIEQNGDTFIAFDGLLDQKKQDEQIRRLIEYGVDAIILIPVDWITVKPALEAISAAGIPLINLDRPVKDLGLVNGVIIEDNYNVGILNAAYMMQILDSAKIGFIERPTVSSAIARMNGFADMIQGHPQYEVVARESTGGNVEDAIPPTRKMMKEHPEISAIMASDDVAAHTVYTKLSGKEIQKYITIPVFLVNKYNVSQYGIGWEESTPIKNFE